jgi:hypothetical protein
MIFKILTLMLPAAMATLTPASPRGEQIISIAGGKSEICVVPKKFPGGNYSKRDLKVEQELCSLGNTVPVAMCPKENSTNPGVGIFTIPEGKTAAQIEAGNCADKEADKVAKYKGSTSCSYAPSLLTYYHMSRILGDIAQVPTAVLRTLDRAHHLDIANKGVAATAKNDLLNQNWKFLRDQLASPSASSRKNTLFTDDLQQSYGALQENPKHEEFYGDMFTKPAGGEVSRTAAFRNRNPIYKLLASSKPLHSLVGNQWQAQNVQAVQQMQDAASMIILDTLLNQQDRFGNIHETENFVLLTDGKVVIKKKMEEAEAKTANAVKVKVMMLKDNDCGVSKENIAKKTYLLEGIAHFSPTVYANLMQLEKQIDAPETKDFFTKETMMTAVDFKSIATNVHEAAILLKQNCKSGKLQLDLDLTAHFTNAPISQSCE